MEKYTKYSSSLTSDQFLFPETRIVSKQYMHGKTVEEIINHVKMDNLFQYPTERKISRIARVCYKRLIALDNKNLIEEIAVAPIVVAKQINLYAMMRYHRLVREFMINLIGEKYRIQDLSYTRKDVNIFFTDLQEQNDDVAGWSDGTITKIKQVLTKCLVETQMLDSIVTTTLNPIFISEELENGIRANNDLGALVAFNCMK